MLIRNDDVSPSTDLERLVELYDCINRAIPSSKIISGITLFGKYNDKESVYPDLPLKDKSLKYLYDTNRILHRHSYVVGEIASHGMFHVKHSQLSKDAQMMSIVGSCRFLGTDTFIAPFNDYNEDTIDVCVENKIELLTKMYDWKSFEHNEFDSRHKFWYFHSWKWSLKSLREYLNNDISKRNSEQLGQLQRSLVSGS